MHPAQVAQLGKGEPMRTIVWGAIASISLLEGYSVAAPVAATSAQLVSLGIAFGTLTALVYRNHEEFTKRLDRVEQRLDSLHEIVRRAKS